MSAPTPPPVTPPTSSAAATFTAAGLVRGLRMSLPFFGSSVVYGVAFGLLAAGLGLSTLEAAAMSALVFSGSAQIAVLQAWTTGPTLLAVFITVIVANIRYILMGAALRPWLAPLGTLKAWLALLPLVDGTFALVQSARARGDHDAGLMIGTGLVALIGWTAGTAFGTLAGQLIANPRAIGLDFIIVAFCAASATVLFRGRSDLWPALTAVAAVVLCETFAPGPWTVAVAGIAAAIAAAILYEAPKAAVETAKTTP